MATISFHQNVVIKDPETVKKLKAAMVSKQSDRPDISPPTVQKKRNSSKLYGEQASLAEDLEIV